MDGNSSIETQNYLNKLEAPFFYHSQKDKGIYDAMNHGVSLSKGEWYYFLGAGDTIEHKNTLSIVSKKLNVNLDILYGNVRYDKTNFTSKFSNLLWIKNTLHHQSVFYNKKLFVKVNYDTNYRVLADYKFNLNLYCENIKAEKIDAIISNCDKEGISKDYNWSLYKASAFAGFLAMIATFAPSARKVSAIARPIPADPPVIAATFPSNFICWSSS